MKINFSINYINLDPGIGFDQFEHCCLTREFLLLNISVSVRNKSLIFYKHFTEKVF